MLTTKIDTTFHETPKRYWNAAVVTYESLNKTNWIQFLCRSVYRRLNVQGYWVLRGDGWNLRWGGGGGKEGLEMREFFNLQLISAPESLNPDRQIDWRWGGGKQTWRLTCRDGRVPIRSRQGVSGGDGVTSQTHLVHTATIYPSFVRPTH
jgi:hypothetical protein